MGKSMLVLLHDLYRISSFGMVKFGALLRIFNWVGVGLGDSRFWFDVSWMYSKIVVRSVWMLNLMVFGSLSVNV